MSEYKDEAPLIFDKDGEIVKANRAFRRRRIKNNVYKKKGFIPYLNAIRVVRKNSGKTKIKYVKLSKSEL